MNPYNSKSLKKSVETMLFLQKSIKDIQHQLLRLEGFTSSEISDAKVSSGLNVLNSHLCHAVCTFDGIIHRLYHGVK